MHEDECMEIKCMNINASRWHQREGVSEKIISKRIMYNSDCG
jgi:hypothetical protein